MELYPRESMPFGKTWEQWAAAWWQWCSHLPTKDNPVSDKTGENCWKNQKHPHVWFLAGTFGGKVVRRCNIPIQRSIFFPVLNDRISFAEDRHLSSEDDLRAYAKADLDNTKHCVAYIDDIEISDLRKYRLQSDLFEFAFPPDIDEELASSHSHAISDGFWVFLKPLCAGYHVIRFFGEKLKFDEADNYEGRGQVPKFQIDVTYHITIVGT
jgi:hypothetical protein